MRPPRWINKRQQLRVGGAFLPCFRLERRLLRWQRRHLHAAGVFPPRHRRRQQLRVEGAFLPCFRLERHLLRWQRRHLHAARVFPPRHRRRQQLRVGGGIPPMFPSGAAPTSLAEATSSRGGGFPAATPAASAAPRGGGIPPMFSSGAAPTSLAEATSSRGGGFPAATAATSAAPRGGVFLPCFNLERRPLRWQRRHLHAAGVFPPRHRRHQQLRVGGGIPPMFSSGATNTSAATVISSRGGGITAAVPAAEVTASGTHVSGSGVGPPAAVDAAPTPPISDPSVATGTATGELSATGQEQLVTSDGRRKVLAEVSRMAGGTSPVDPGALGPPDMVHDGGAGGRWEGQRVTPAVTRSRAKRDGLWPGTFALMATQEDIARSIAELSPPDVVETELPSELACIMETPETYVQAHTGPHHDIWTEAESKELRGLNATGTFEAAGSE